MSAAVGSSVSSFQTARKPSMLSRKRPRPPPLQACSICVGDFGLDERDLIAAQVQRLGGEVSEELRPNTTHFLCEKAGSAGHRAVCLRNSRAGVTPIIIVRQSWLQSCEAASMLVKCSAHVLQPLTGLNICSTGFDRDERDEISNLAVSLGALYSKSLTVECTHLICRSPNGNKYNFALEVSHMFIVRLQWLKQCTELNLLLDESRFSLDVDDAKETRTTSGTEVPTSIAGSSITNSNSNSKDPTFSKWQDVPPGDVLDAVTLYLTESPLRDNDRHAPLRAKALQLANLGGASISTELTDVVNYIVVVRMPIAPSRIQTIREAQEHGTITATIEWLEDCILQQKLLDTTKYQVPQLGEVMIPDSSQPSSQVQVTTSSVFLGVRVAVGPLAVRDSSTTYSVCSQLSSGRAKILAHDAAGYVTSGSPTHVLCSHNVTSTESEVIKDAQRRNSRVLKVTQFWVDMCVKAEGLLPVSVCALFSPVPYETPLHDMVVQQVSLSISGFQNAGERDWNRRREVLKRLAVLLGAKCSERMRRRQTSYLVADSRFGNSEKVLKAREWGIKVVTHEWLLACARAGKVVGAEGYALGTETTPTRSPASKKDVEQDESNSIARTEMPDAEAINLFQKLTEKFDREVEQGGENHADEGMAENIRFSRRSRSASREAIEDERSWSIDASQSQVIVHRDLTPPPSPTQRIKRGRQTK
ncbi:unnamed protein product [Agarophyton chilense]|eukprot:gb/GEZJ01004566.1/.p1 GENE.gb/GEZJ01004566.1/~~gb/GEZJ01004566.1/.p1  ORF type:complete len:702 (-),score=62.07 gb/GEZJ01004566.1/:1199-3304(-)